MSTLRTEFAAHLDLLVTTKKLPPESVILRQAQFDSALAFMFQQQQMLDDAWHHRLQTLPNWIDYLMKLRRENPQKQDVTIMLDHLLVLSGPFFADKNLLDIEKAIREMGEEKANDQTNMAWQEYTTDLSVNPDAPVSMSPEEEVAAEEHFAEVGYAKVEAPVFGFAELIVLPNGQRQIKIGLGMSGQMTIAPEVQLSIEYDGQGTGRNSGRQVAAVRRTVLFSDEHIENGVQVTLPVPVNMPDTYEVIMRVVDHTIGRVEKTSLPIHAQKAVQVRKEVAA